MVKISHVVFPLILHYILSAEMIFTLTPNFFTQTFLIQSQTVGSVVFEEKYKDLVMDSKQKVYRGEKLGHFAYGGSTVLLIFEKNRLSSVSVQQGQRIGKLQK